MMLPYWDRHASLYFRCGSSSWRGARITLLVCYFRILIRRVLTKIRIRRGVKVGYKSIPADDAGSSFHTIISNSLFVTVDHSLLTVHSLSNLRPMKAGARGAVNAWLHRAGFGIVRNFFFLFPVIGCFAVFCLDRWSYFMNDPFDVHFEAAGLEPFFWRSLVVFFVCWIPLTLCCIRARRYSTDTEKVLNQYGGKLRADLLRKKPLARS